MTLTTSLLDPLKSGHVMTRRLRSVAATTPGRLRLWGAGIWLLTAVFVIAALVAVEKHRHEMQTIGRDSAPSIIAAQSIKWNVAEMHANLVAQYLGSPPQAETAAKEVRQRRARVIDGLITAAQNITYGDEERLPILNLMVAMADYDDSAARANVLRTGHDDQWIAPLRTADAIVQDRLYPAANALDEANRNALNIGYTVERSRSFWSTVVFVVSAAAMVGCVVGAQLDLRRRTRRGFSPTILAAGLLAAGWFVFVFISLRAESSDLKSAKEDSFDSITALWHARADATDAQANLNLAVLDPQSAEPAMRRFDRDSANLVTLGDGLSYDALLPAVEQNDLPAAFKGYIAAELRNITFEGEKEAATDMLRQYGRYAAVTSQILRSDRLGRHANSVEQLLGDRPEQAGGARAAFDSALNKTLEINQHEFDRSVDRGFADVAGLDFWNVVAGLAIAGLAQVEIYRRLAEYRK